MSMYFWHLSMCMYADRARCCLFRDRQENCFRGLWFLWEGTFSWHCDPIPQTLRWENIRSRILSLLRKKGNHMFLISSFTTWNYSSWKVDWQEKRWKTSMMGTRENSHKVPWVWVQTPILRPAVQQGRRTQSPQDLFTLTDYITLPESHRLQIRHSVKCLWIGQGVEVGKL